MFDRQKITGWILVAVSTAFILYFLKVRLLGTGPVLERKEWFQFIVSIVVLMIGTMNIRLAARRAERLNDRKGVDKSGATNSVHLSPTGRGRRRRRRVWGILLPWPQR